MVIGILGSTFGTLFVLVLYVNLRWRRAPRNLESFRCLTNCGENGYPIIRISLDEARRMTYRLKLFKDEIPHVNFNSLRVKPHREIFPHEYVFKEIILTNL